MIVERFLIPMTLFFILKTFGMFHLRWDLVDYFIRNLEKRLKNFNFEENSKFLPIVSISSEIKCAQATGVF
jgi:hypothetical protein